MKKRSSTVVVALLALLLVGSDAARHRKYRQTYQDIDSDDETSDVQITVFPSEKEVRDGRDVSFECRARTSDNSVYPTVRWARVGGPLPASAHDSGGRLTINPVQLSDAGTYICVSDYNGQTVEARATLNVVSYGPQEVSNSNSGLRQSGQCMADEKACGNNECVKNDYVCDGEPDCRDRSDEANCPAMSRTCEPNEFKCNNNKCVQKMWLCDGDDDCGDNSDELNCNAKPSDNGCKPTEFQCHDRRQCVPSSFHCDGTNDCHDGSDEVGCVQPTVVDPPQTNLQVPRGSTFSLTCKAVAVPEPYINWRLNWGPVCEPPRCLQTSEGGYGTLTIHDAQPVDQGAYTCEAINVKGRVLATPDCIVRVVDEQPRPQPPPTAPPQRATCDTRGAVSPYPNNYGSCDCKSQVTGPNCDQCKPGAFHLSEKSPEGCLKCFCFGVSNDCRSSGYYRTKVSIDYSRGDRDQLELTTSDSRQPFSPQTRAHVSGQAIEFRSFEEARGQTLYWKLPEKFLGDKVTSYGGVFKYTFKFSGSGSTDQSADVILRGNDIALQYKHREPFHPDRENNVEIKIFETSWQRVDGQQATREHLLMTLADLDTILIKSTYNDDCTDSQLISVNFEYAEPYGQGLTAAEVEQCICPPGYVGTSCEDCAPGYSRTGGGLYLGLCEKCECNGHASQCDKEYGYCLDCQHNTEGDQCERCKPGFVGDARRGTPNDCQPEATRAPCHCNNHSPRGCDSFGRCLLCEHNTEGTHCERCKKGYYGDATKGSPYDCTPCPCPGASDCYLDNEGQVACRICPAGLQGRLCNECAPGYTRSNKPAGRVCEPIGQVTNEDITFVQKPHEGDSARHSVVSHSGHHHQAHQQQQQHSQNNNANSSSQRRHRRRRIRVRSRFYHQ